MTILLAYWKFIAGIGVGFLAAWVIQAQIIHSIEGRAAKALAAQMQFDIKQCEDNKQITTRTEQHYEDIIAKRDADIRDYKLRHPASCNVPIARPAGIGHAANVKSESGIRNGIPAGALLDFAAFCETDRAKVISLQSFITEERKLNQ